MEKNSAVAGGKAVYGASVGMLMLETRFPRIPGDIGNAGTWPFPVLYKVVRGASPDHVVRRGAEGFLIVCLFRTTTGPLRSHPTAQACAAGTPRCRGPRIALSGLP